MKFRSPSLKCGQSFRKCVGAWLDLCGFCLHIEQWCCALDGVFLGMREGAKIFCFACGGGALWDCFLGWEYGGVVRLAEGAATKNAAIDATPDTIASNTPEIPASQYELAIPDDCCLD